MARPRRSRSSSILGTRTLIFATVGTQLPFDRLMIALNKWASDHPEEEVIAQTGPTKSTFPYLTCSNFLSPSQVEQATSACRLVVAHAGMGTVLTALRFKKPVILMPRKASFGEHRNEHQLATARWLKSTPGIYVAWETDDLTSLLSTSSFGDAGGIVDYAQPELLNRLKEFIAG